jgi:peptidoglycan-associated lipoprotein
MRRITTSAIIVFGALALSACGSSVKLDEGAAKVEERSGVPPKATSSTDSRTIAPVTTASADPLNDPQGILARRSVYFDYDSFIVKDEFKPVLEAHARYLNTNRTRRVVLQGHTDERGGREYNLALGQKRAEAVRRSLTLLGVPEAQMESVSFGKEKPKAMGSDESAFAENRRADIAYQ